MQQRHTFQSNKECNSVNVVDVCIPSLLTHNDNTITRKQVKVHSACDRPSIIESRALKRVALRGL